MKLLVDLNLPFCHFFSLCLLSLIFLHLSSSGSMCHFNSTTDFLFQIIHYSKPSEPLSTTTKLQVLIGCSHLLKSLLYNKGQGVVQLCIFFQRKDMNVSSFIAWSPTLNLFSRIPFFLVFEHSPVTLLWK